MVAVWAGGSSVGRQPRCSAFCAPTELQLARAPAGDRERMLRFARTFELRRDTFAAVDANRTSTTVPEDVAEHVSDLRKAKTASFLMSEICRKDKRLEQLQQNLNIIDMRAQTMADVPGGTTGLLVVQYKGKSPRL